MAARFRIPPALALYLLAPAIAELLSGSMPPAEFFNPFNLLLVTLLYGGGAILVRELVLRWGKGWPSLLALGAAYGIVEEGLACKSFFDPNWPDVGILGQYGRWAGVNWVWSLELTVYHAVVSIAVPILLVGLLYPDRRSESWVGRRTFRTLAVLMAAEVVFMYLAITPYRPAPGLVVLAIAAVAGLGLLARRLPAPLPAVPGGRVARARTFWLTGFLSTAAFFVLCWAGPSVIPAPGMLVLLIAGLCLFAGRRLYTLRASSGPQQVALAAGILSFFIVLAPLQELDRTRPDNPAGMTMVALAVALGLIALARNVRRAAARTGEHPGVESAACQN